MKVKWIPITQSHELNNCAIVTREISNGVDVTIGLPGWGLQNKTIAYMHLPSNINEDPFSWKSEYRGDELPEIKDSKRFIVQLQGISMHNQNKLKIQDICYSAKDKRWLAVPDGWEVIAWTAFPKPYTKY